MIFHVWRPWSKSFAATNGYRRQRRKRGWGEFPSKRVTQELPRMLAAITGNACEHGDHPAPAGKRFCSYECETCECSSLIWGCDGLCNRLRASPSGDEGGKG